MKRRSRRLNFSVLAFYCSIVLLFYCSPILGQDFRDSLVRVYLNREYAGVVHGSRYIPHIHVQEIAELQGVVIDSRGYVVSYVGSYWPELSLPGVEHSHIDCADFNPHTISVYASRPVRVGNRQ